MSLRSTCHALAAAMLAFAATLALQPAAARASEGVEIRYAAAMSMVTASRPAIERRSGRARAACGLRERFEVRSVAS